MPRCVITSGRCVPTRSEIKFKGPLKTGYWVKNGKRYSTYEEAKMGRKKIPINEQVVLDAAREGITLSRLLMIVGGMDRETLKSRVQELVAAGKLFWADKGAKGRAGVVKTA